MYIPDSRLAPQELVPETCKAVRYKTIDRVGGVIPLFVFRGNLRFLLAFLGLFYY